MQAMTSLCKPQPDMLHQANWKDTRPDTVFQLTIKHLEVEKRHTSHHSHSTSKKRSTAHCTGSQQTSQGTVSVSITAWNMAEGPERREASRYSLSTSVMVGQLRGLSERGRRAGTWVAHDKHHSLDAALGRHRHLPSADWWEPTQSPSKTCYWWLF